MSATTAVDDDGPVEQGFAAADLQLVQVMDECHQALDTAPVSHLAADEPFVTACRLHEVLGSMLATATAERRLREDRA